MDGPVVQAAKRALAAADVDLVLPYVPPDGEEEIRAAFDSATAARGASDAARVVADRWFFETVVRIHRAGEGATFTGLKPAGLGHGPVVPVAEHALETGNCDDLVRLLASTVEEQVRSRFARALDLRPANGDVESQREYVEAMLGLEVWSHKLYAAATSPAHGHASPSAQSPVGITTTGRSAR